jgi:hypothetical protein
MPIPPSMPAGPLHYEVSPRTGSAGAPEDRKALTIINIRPQYSLY